MQSGLAEAGHAIVSVAGEPGRVLTFSPTLADPRGMRVVELVAMDCAVPARALFNPDRRRADVAMARQLAMYLMHVQLGRLYVDVGRFFRRDRTTVSYACGVIEEMREDPGFDERIARLEATLAADAIDDREASHAAA